MDTRIDFFLLPDFSEKLETSLLSNACQFSTLQDLWQRCDLEKGQDEKTNRTRKFIFGKHRTFANRQL
jgi:hypothetical protein